MGVESIQDLGMAIFTYYFFRKSLFIEITHAFT